MTRCQDMLDDWGNMGMVVQRRRRETVRDQDCGGSHVHDVIMC